MPVSIRRQKELDAAREAAPFREYRIVDPYHTPDLRGELGGCKVYRVGGEQRVKMPDATARFYLDQGAVELVQG